MNRPGALANGAHAAVMMTVSTWKDLLPEAELDLEKVEFFLDKSRESYAEEDFIKTLTPKDADLFRVIKALREMVILWFQQHEGLDRPEQARLAPEILNLANNFIIEDETLQDMLVEGDTAQALYRFLCRLYSRMLYTTMEPLKELVKVLPLFPNGFAWEAAQESV